MQRLDMYTSLLITLLLTTLCLPLQAQLVDIKIELRSNFTPDTINQRLPEFPGGMGKLNQYIKENLRYPKTAQAAGLTGMVLVGFLINKQGKIEKVHVVKEISPELDAEAIRLIESMPDWTPQKVDGQAVDCRYHIPINFTRK